MSSLKKRIAALEAQIPARVPPKPVFIQFVTPGELEPETMGWYFDDDAGRQIRVMREQNETEETLRARAVAAAADAKPDSFGLLLFHIH